MDVDVVSSSGSRSNSAGRGENRGARRQEASRSAGASPRGLEHRCRAGDDLVQELRQRLPHTEQGQRHGNLSQGRRTRLTRQDRPSATAATSRVLLSTGGEVSCPPVGRTKCPLTRELHLLLPVLPDEPARSVGADEYHGVATAAADHETTRPRGSLGCVTPDDHLAVTVRNGGSNLGRGRCREP